MTHSFFAAVVGFIAIVLGNAPSSAQNAYIPSGNTVSVIHTPTNTLGAPIPVGAPTTGAVAVSPDGRKVYVGTGNAISVIDTLANAVIRTIPIGAPASSLIVGPYGRRLYVSGAPNGILVIGTETGNVIGTIPGGGISFVVTPDGNKLYITGGLNTVLAFDTETYALIDTITLQPTCFFDPTPTYCTMYISPSRIAVSPDGSKLYVGYKTWGTSYDVGGNVAAIDTATDTQLPDAITLNRFLSEDFGVNDLIVGPNGDIYVEAPTWNGPALLYMIFASDGSLVSQSGAPWGLIGGFYDHFPPPGNLGVTPDGTKLYIATDDNTGGGLAPTPNRSTTPAERMTREWRDDP